MASSRPKVILSAAMSLDGKLATYSGDSKLSSKLDLLRVHKMRSKVDAILVGRNTINIDDPLLTVRHVRGKNPVRIVVSSRGDISTKSRILKTSRRIATIVACSEKISHARQASLEKLSVCVMTAGKNSVDLKRLLSLLYQKGIRTVLLEGGGTTNWEFVRNNLVDEILITVTPVVLGGSSSTTLVDGTGFSKISGSSRFGLKKATKNGDELVLQYVKL